MVYTEDFFRSLPSDLLEADRLMLAAFDPLANRSLTDETHLDLLESFSAYQAFRRSRDLTVSNFVPSYEQTSNWNTMRSFIAHYKSENARQIRQRQVQQVFERGQEWFQGQSGAPFLHEFAEEDIGRIRQLLAEIRDLITGTDELDQNHKQRLFRRLDQLENELAKKVSDLDRFWGLFGDVNVAIRKLWHSYRERC